MALTIGSELSDIIAPGTAGPGITGGPVTDLGDAIFGLGGNDVINGGAGGDTLDGGEGDDTLDGGAGDDVILWSPGSDRMVGGAGRDIADYSAAPDWARIYLWSQNFNNRAADGDRLSGFEILIGTRFGDTLWNDSTGFTTLFGGDGDDAVIGFNGRDTLYGDNGHDRVDGSGGDDWLEGGAGNDTLLGGPGNDTMTGGAGSDSLEGDTGNDTFIVDDVGDRVAGGDSQGGDTDVVFVTVDDWSGAVDVEVIRLYGTATRVTGGNRDENIVANPNAGSTIFADSGNDTLWGSAFADYLHGGSGFDTLYGQGGADTLAGGLNDDKYLITDATATIVELSGEGMDIAWVAVDGFTSAGEVEILRLHGTATGVRGSAGAEQLVANPGRASLLDGGAGADTLWGGTGADTLIGGAGNDTLYTGGGAPTGCATRRRAGVMTRYRASCLAPRRSSFWLPAG
jgi:trimeric autotransporter adhesin